MEQFLASLYFTTLHLTFVILVFRSRDYKRIIDEQKREIYHLKTGQE